MANKKTRAEKKAEFRGILKEARQQVRQYIIVMVAVYIGFQVMTSFMRLDVELVVTAISGGLGVAIFAMLFFTTYRIKKGRALLEGPNKEDPEQTLVIKELRDEVNDLKKEIAWIKSIRE